MKKFILLIFVFFLSISAFAERIPNQMGLDWNTNGPAGKNWVKATDIHYLNKKSIKKVKGTIYQARLCNHLKLPNGGDVWNYFNVRVDCKSKQAYTQFKSDWIGPLGPSDYDEAVLKHACK
jgi:hypothetical protein